jgi:uncharacterized membrane protein YfcA
MELPYLLFVLVAMGAAIFSAVFGIGTALLLLGIGAYILPVRETIVLVTVLLTATTISKTFVFREFINWRLVGMLSICSLPFAYFGASLVSVAPTELLRKAMGVMVLVYVLLEVTNWRPTFKINRVGMFAGSGLYGFLSGVLGSGNVVIIMMLRQMGYEKEALVGAMAGTTILANVVKLTAYTQSGLLTPRHTPVIVALIAVAVIIAFVGRSILKRMSTQAFQRGFIVMLALVGIGLLIK